MTVCLHLADGTSWGISGRNPMAERMVERLAEVMRLRPSESASHTLRVTVEDDSSAREHLTLNGTTVECTVGAAATEDMLAARLQQLSQTIPLASRKSGGMLLHGALLENHGEGVILAGHGGAGKTTACRRVPSPWHPLCDDTTFILRDGEGRYHAHPWPTWSRFMFGGPGGTWQTETSVPLKGVFILRQGEEDRAEPLGRGEAACLLSECCEQVTWSVFQSFSPKEVRTLRTDRFDAVCDLTGSVPVFRLGLTRNGAFWSEMGRVL